MQKMEFDYELSDDTTGRVRVPNRALIAWDETRSKRKWPSATEAPSLWQTFIVWHALTRSGKVGTDVTFDAFKDDVCLQLEMVDDDDEAEVPPTVPTTTPTPSPGSPSPADPTAPVGFPGGTRPTTD